MTAHAGRGIRSLHACVSGADDDYIKVHVVQFVHLPPTTYYLTKRLLPDAELLKDVRQHILARTCADDLVEPHARRLEVAEDELFRDPGGGCRVAGGGEMAARFFEKR